MTNHRKILLSKVLKAPLSVQEHIPLIDKQAEEYGVRIAAPHRPIGVVNGNEIIRAASSPHKGRHF